MRTTRTATRWSALAVSLALLLAACGGDDDGAAGDDGGTDGAATDGTTDGTDGQAAACDSPGVSEDQILVGAAVPQSGRAAPFYGPMEQGWQARIDSLNEDEGGIGGRTIELVTADSPGDPTRSREAARELVEQQGVFGVILGEINTSNSAEYYNEQGVPVTGYNVTPEWGEYDNMFGFNGSNAVDPTAATTTLGTFMHDQQGGTQLATFGYASQAVEIAGNVAATSFEAAGGEVVYRSFDAEPTGEWTRQANETADAGADAVYLPLQTQLGIPAVQALQQAGVTPDETVITMAAGYGPSTLEEAADLLEGVTFSNLFVPFEAENPGHDEVREDLEQYAAEAPRNSEFVAGWMSADLFIRGIEEAGAECPTRADFIENLRAVDDWSADGLLNPAVDFSESFGEPIGTCLYFVQIQDGEFVDLTDGEAICGEMISQDGSGDGGES